MGHTAAKFNILQGATVIWVQLQRMKIVVLSSFFHSTQEPLPAAFA